MRRVTAFLVLVLALGCDSDGYGGPYMQTVTTDSVTIGFQAPVDIEGDLEWGDSTQLGTVVQSPKQKEPDAAPVRLQPVHV